MATAGHSLKNDVILALLVIMAALWNKAGHYIFILWFLSIFYLFSLPNLSGHTLDDWMSTILRHMVWP